MLLAGNLTLHLVREHSEMVYFIVRAVKLMRLCPEIKRVSKEAPPLLIRVFQIFIVIVDKYCHMCQTREYCSKYNE